MLASVRSRLGRRPLVNALRARAHHAARWRPRSLEFPLFARPLAGETPPGAVTRGFAERVTTDQRAELARRLPPERRRWWEGLSEEQRLRVTAPLALAYGVPGVEQATGLSAAMPPPDVHAMAHVDIATGGAAYYGDLIVDSLEATGAPLAELGSVLDFGCSSGRVVRVLKAWEPAPAYAGCDPNGPAVDWASEHLTGIRFFESRTRPPLEEPDEAHDLVFAVSVWSHFDAEPGLRWLDEMWRITKPGGRLIVTTEGYAALRGLVERDSSPANKRFLESIMGELYVRGFFFSVFGDDDWGVPAEGWGMAFMTPEWLLTRLTPRWRLEQFAPGRVEQRQDLYVLSKR